MPIEGRYFHLETPYIIEAHRFSAVASDHTVSNMAFQSTGLIKLACPEPDQDEVIVE